MQYCTHKQKIKVHYKLTNICALNLIDRTESGLESHVLLIRLLKKCYINNYHYSIRAGGMSSQMIQPNLTIRTMQLNAWVADNFMNIEILFLLLTFCTTEYLVSMTMNRMHGRPIILHHLICLFYPL